MVKTWTPTKLPGLNIIPIALLDKTGTQVRETHNEEAIASYTEILKEGGKLPPVEVVWDGETPILKDGFHRTEATLRSGKISVDAMVTEGTRRDAILGAVECNLKHGLRFTNADKRKIVGIFLEDAEWSKWSDHEIARKVGCSQPFVTKARSSLITVISEKSRTYTTKHGTQAVMKTDKIGKKNAENQDTRNEKPQSGKWSFDIPESKTASTKSSKPEFHHSFDHLVLLYDAVGKLVAAADDVNEIPQSVFASVRDAWMDAFNAARE